MQQKFNIIYADPPWSYSSERPSHNEKPQDNRGGATKHYETMSIEDLCSLPVGALAAKDCVLFIWGTWPKMHEILKVIDAWGFAFKTCAFVWIKTNKRTNTKQFSFLPQDSFDSFWGMGRWTRANSEFCLLATKGEPERKSASVHQVIYAPIDKHSKKPEETREKIIELCGDVPRLEMFARTTVQGWELWGNEIESTVSM